MNKSNWRNKFNKKTIIYLIGIFSIAGAIIATVSIKLANPYKPAFLIYSSYVDKQTKENIDKEYSIKEYGSVDEFDYAISNKKTIGGITSDYLIVNLIKEGKISPISKELSKIVFDSNIPYDYSRFFSEEVNDQMNKYNYGFVGYGGILNDEKLQNELRAKYPEYGINYQFRINDFIVPYFINDRVYAFDTKKIIDKTYNEGEEINPLGFECDKNGIPLANSTINVLKKITKKKNVVIQWTKNEIENAVIGSELNSNFSTNVDEGNYIELIDNFSKIVFDGTGASISDGTVNIFEPDSNLILNNLVNPSSRIKAAVLYNGDALDAYYGSDNFNNINDGDRIRIVRTKNNIRILDAFVISSDISKEKRFEIINFFNKNLFNYMFKTYDQINNEVISNGNDFDIYQTDGIMRIFDYVNYTPAAKGPLEYIEKNYFKFKNSLGQLVDDNVALDIFRVSKTALPIAPFDKQTFSKVVSLFQKKING